MCPNSSSSTEQYENNRPERSREANWIRERGARKFKSTKQAQKFLSAHVAVSHTLASVHEIEDGLILRWSNYWDIQKFVGQFPAWFIEEMMKASADDFTD